MACADNYPLDFALVNRGQLAGGRLLNARFPARPPRSFPAVSAARSLGWFVAAGVYLILVRVGSDRPGAATASASPSAEAATAG